MEDHNDLNALAYAARFNSLSAIEFLLNTTEGIKFDQQQQLKLMKFSWRHDLDITSLESGYGSDEETGVKKPVSAADIAHMAGRNESVEVLERLKVDSMIRVSIETKNPGWYIDVLHRVTNWQHIKSVSVYLYATYMYVNGVLQSVVIIWGMMRIGWFFFKLTLLNPLA